MSLMKKFAAGLLGLALPVVASAADPVKVPAAGGEITVNVKAAEADGPKVILKLGKRTGTANPCKGGCNHTGGGNIDVQQPTPDTIVVTMSGAAVAYGGPCGGNSAGFDFCLDQLFNVSIEDEAVKAAKLKIEGRVIGVLRSSCKGGSAEEHGEASVACGTHGVLALAMPGHTVGGGENLSVNDSEGPECVTILPGCYNLHQTFHISACAPKCLLKKGPSVEFGDGNLDAIWLSYKEPFFGIAKKDFGFQVTLTVEAADVKDVPAAAPAATPAATLNNAPAIISATPTALPYNAAR